MVIFHESDDYRVIDDKEWIQCVNPKCERWIHIECEEQQGIKSIRQEISNSLDEYCYICPDCRNSPRQSLEIRKGKNGIHKKLEINTNFKIKPGQKNKNLGSFAYDRNPIKKSRDTNNSRKAMNFQAENQIKQDQLEEYTIPLHMNAHVKTCLLYTSPSPRDS
eukprot:TRINITY_DN6297_c0_g1_i2.p2 TRINITY_DN6297_c0_g1~~TRINITY_DN6297_c0_g1_i2.p2  ORF type:complete len:163 (+),score=24.17 TRINITY_DN6297_c0_g1_i2:253-741(+)